MPLNNIDSSYPSKKGEALVWLTGGRYKNPCRPEAFVCDKVVTKGPHRMDAQYPIDRIRFRAVLSAFGTSELCAQCSEISQNGAPRWKFTAEDRDKSFVGAYTVDLN